MCAPALLEMSISEPELATQRNAEKLQQDQVGQRMRRREDKERRKNRATERIEAEIDRQRTVQRMGDRTLPAPSLQQV